MELRKWTEFFFWFNGWLKLSFVFFFYFNYGHLGLFVSLPRQRRGKTQIKEIPDKICMHVRAAGSPRSPGGFSALNTRPDHMLWAKGPNGNFHTGFRLFCLRVECP